MAVKADRRFTGHCTLSGGRHWWIKAVRTPGHTAFHPTSWTSFLEELIGCEVGPAQEPALDLVLFGMNINDPDK